MSRAVLDASALIAFASNEAGGKKVEPYLDHAFMSSVNYYECLQRLTGKQHITLEDAVTYLKATPLKFVDYDIDHAIVAASLRPQAKLLGLSLGDTACIALGLILGLPVVTADSAWKKLKLDIPIVSIR